MDDLRLHAVVARVVAWHNRHPLARRITAAQVNSVGYLALPYTSPGLPPPAPPPPEAPVLAPEPQEQEQEQEQEQAQAQAQAQPPEPVDVDPVSDDDAGSIVIDVDPEPGAAAEDNPGSMTLEREMPAAAAGEPPPTDPSAAPEPATEAGPAGDGGATASDLPLAAPPAPEGRSGSSLRARVAAGESDALASSGAATDPEPQAVVPPPGTPRTLVCSEDFMAPLPPDQVLAWVQTHGLALPREPRDGPVRQVPVDATLLPAGAGVGQLWVATADIDLGGQRHRLLLGGGAQPAVLGRRVWSRPRLLGAVAAPCVLVAAALWLMWPAAPAVAVPAAAVAVGTEPAASAALVDASPASAASAPQASASAAADDPRSRATSDRPPRLPVLLDDDAKAQARATVAALRAERQASASASAAAAPPPAAAMPAAPAAKPAAPPAVLYGLSTLPLRTRAEAEQLQSAFLSLLGGTPGSTLRVEVLPAGEDWRVVCWPYERRADAVRARARLVARGLRVELVDF